MRSDLVNRSSAINRSLTFEAAFTRAFHAIGAACRGGTLLAMLTVCGIASAHDYTSGALHILHPQTRETPLEGATALGDLTIENTGSVDDRLLSAHSDAAASIEIHQMSMVGGVMRMRAQTEGLRLPAKSTVALGADAPGGYHLMLIGVKRQLVAGENIPVRLQFAKAGAIDVEFVVQALNGSGPAPAR